MSKRLSFVKCISVFVFVFVMLAGAALSSAGEESKTFTISKIEPVVDKDQIKVTFTEGVDMNALKRSLQIIPPVRLSWRESGMEGDTVLRLQGQFRHDTKYRISILRDMTSKNQKLYEPSLVEFLFPNPPSSIRPVLGRNVIERDSRQLMYFEIRNTDNFYVQLTKVPPILVGLMNNRVYSEKDGFERLQREYTVLEERFGDEPELADFFRAPRQSRQLLFPRTKKNEMERFAAALTFRDQPQAGSVEIMSHKRPEGEWSTGPKLRITDLGVTFKKSKGRLLVWVTSLRTGLPVEGVEIAGAGTDHELLYLGATDEEGILEVSANTSLKSYNLDLDSVGMNIKEVTPTIEDIETIVAVTEVDYTYLNCKKTIENPHDIENQVAGKKGSIFTERGIYRPGETVHFKGVVRRLDPDKNEVSLPKLTSCVVNIYDPRGTEIYTKELEYSHFGSVHDSVQLPTFSKLGTYSVNLRIDQMHAAYTSFQVQEFREPRHYVDVAFKHSSRQVEDYINREYEEHLLTFTISGTYYVGGPVKDGKAQWQIYTAPSNLHAEGYEQYSFGSGDNYEEHFIEAGESVLNASGEVSVTIPVDDAVLSGLHGIKVIATVLDFDGRSALVSERFSADPEYLVGIAKHKAELGMQEPQSLEMIVLDSDREPLGRGEILVETYRRGHYYHRKREADGDLYWRWDTNWDRMDSVRVPIRNGKAIFDFSFSQPGEHLIRAHYITKDGNTYTSGTVYFIRYPYRYYGEPDSLRATDYAELSPDRSKYSVGDEIELFVSSEFPADKALVTVEREDLFEYHVVDLEDNRFALNAKAEYQPNVYVSVVGVMGRGDFPTYPGEYDDEAPNLFYGVAKVDIEKKVNDIAIEIAPEMKSIEARPVDEISLSLQVVDQQGEGVYSELAIAVVDEQILALTAFKTPDLSDLSRFVIPLKVKTGDLRRELQYQTPFGEFANLPVTGGDGMAGQMRPMDVKYREDYRPVAFWDAEIRTDEEGKTTIKFKFPDTMTRYRIYAVACDKGNRFASAERAATVVKPFYFEPGLPAFLNAGDEFTFDVAAFNKTNQAGTASFTIGASGSLEVKSGLSEVDIDSYGRTLIPVEGRATSPGKAEIRMSGQLRENQDAVKVTVPVKSGYLIDHDFVFGHASTNQDVGYSFPEGTKDLLLGSLDKSELSVTLTLAIDLPLLQIRPGLEYLLRYPYGCVEQTSSGILPLAAMREMIRTGYLPGINILETDKYIGRGIDLILSMQLDNGGFTYWPGYQQAALWPTLYAMSALTFARNAGFSIPDSNFNLGLQYLQQQEETDERWLDASGQGLAAFILAKGDSLSNESYLKFKKDYKRLNQQGKLLLLMAAKMKGYDSKEFIEKETADLLRNPERVDRYHHYYYNARYRNDAVRLMAAKMIFPSSPEVDDMAGNLLRHMKPDGRYTSTSDTGWVLTALAEYIDRSSWGDGAASGRVLIGEEEVAKFELKSGSWKTFDLGGERFVNHPNIRIVLDNDRSVFYELAVTFPRADYAEKGYSKGFGITKSISNTNGEEAIKVGDVVEVEISISADASDYRDIVLDDPLPAGLSAINPALATEAPTVPDRRSEGDWYYQYWNPGGYYRFYPHHVEFKADRVLAFRESIWSGEYRYKYYARAIATGEFRVPSSKVQLMYEPDTKAFTKGTRVTIHE